MKEYDFTLTFRFNKSEVNPETYLDALYKAGCDDALLGIGKPGYLVLNFIRLDSSAMSAIQSAISDIKTVLTEREAKLIYVAPDLVGIRELADIFQCTGQNIQKFVNKSTFPSPIYQGSQTIWHLAPVLEWFVANNHAVNKELLEIAELANSINLQIETQTAKPQILNKALNLLNAS
ncbi:MAG: DNA-binding protein [Gomphosphaeria aponina SAG 52.96 = DSM 107014]|uniref:DNA-binding protein n=1 Tax=Gomphosphaeria aponina SAG 52.96 = DSM 107014 TaxID=1521640 RepID=A0A941GU74_9CHRO|nr:DNA-binding protein [Gomphosphaeria aponina SAG 52.96 = DSM 107014]